MADKKFSEFTLKPTPDAGDEIVGHDGAGDNIRIPADALGGGVTDHGALNGLGDDDHTQYSRISSGSGAPSSTPSRVGLIYVNTTADTAYISTGTASSADWTQTDNVASDAHIADGTIHFTEASIDHTAIQSVGNNSHADIDSHISDTGIHFTEGSIDHGNILGLGDDDHSQYSIISSGAGVPSATPVRVGAVYIDTSNDVSYIAVGAASAADWARVGQVNTVVAGEAMTVDASDPANPIVISDKFSGNGAPGHVPDPVAASGQFLRDDGQWADPPDTGEVNDGANVGTGEGTIYRDKTGVDINLKTIKAGTGVIITDNADDVTIDATGAGGGEANTASTPAATGEELTMPKNGVDLPFKSVVAGTNITLTPTADTLTIDSAGGGVTDHGALDGLLDDDHTQYSLISSGAGSPSSTPSREGLIYVDTTNDFAYISTGTASSADWTQTDNVASDAHIADDTIHFTEASIDHTNIQSVGTNTHTDIDNHIGDASIHFTEGSIDHGNILGLLDDDHTQYSIISSGAGAPVSTPTRVGAVYIDTTNDHVYIAVDTVDANSWKRVDIDNVGGQVDSVVAGTGISVDATDPVNPIVTNTAPNADQDASEVPITDAGGYYTATDVEGALQEIAPEVDANTALAHAAVTSTPTAEITTTVTGQDLTSVLNASSIDETKLDASVNASLDLADSSVQTVNTQPGPTVTLDTDDIADTPTNRYTSDTDITRLANTSGTNTGDEVLFDNAGNDGIVPTSQTGYTGTRVLQEDATWVEQTGGATKIVDALWNFSTTTTMVDPGAGNVRFDQSIFNNVTQIAIADLTNQGTDFYATFGYVAPGAILFFKQADDPTREVLFRVTASVAQSGGWQLLDVTFLERGTSGTGFEDGKEVGGARVSRDTYIQATEAYTVGTLGGEDFATFDEAVAFIADRPYAVDRAEQTVTGNLSKVAYELVFSAQTHTITDATVNFRYFTAEINIKGVGATIVGDIVCSGRGTVTIDEVAITGQVTADNGTVTWVGADGTNTRLVSGQRGYIVISSAGRTFRSIRSVESGTVRSELSVTASEYVAAESDGRLNIADLVVNGTATYNDAVVYVEGGGRINAPNTLTLNGGDGGSNPNLFGAIAITGGQITGGDFINNTTFANTTNIIPGEWQGDGSIISDSSTPSSVENAKNYFDSYKGPDEPIVIFAYGDSNLEGGLQNGGGDIFPTVDNSNIFVWQPDNIATNQKPTCSWKQAGVDFSVNDATVLWQPEPSPKIGMILGQTTVTNTNNRGNIGYFLADQIQKRSGRKVYLYEISAPGTDTGYWLNGQAGYTDLVDGTYGLAAAITAVGPTYTRTAVDITFNCNATNDSFRTTSTGLFQVDADTFVANIKQFRETDVLAADGRQWFHSEPAVIVNGEGPTTGTGTYYPFAWHGLDYLDGETNDTDKVVSSWDLQTNGPTDVHYLGDSLNALGLVAADSAIVGPIPKRHIRRQTFVDRFNPVIENAMDCQDNRVDNCRGLGFAPTGVLDVLTEPGIIDISGSYETQPGANTSFQPAVKYAPTIDLKGSGNFLTGYSQLFLSNALLELNPGNGTQMGRFITLFAAPRYANNTGGTVTFGAVNNGVDIQVTPEIINSPGGDISVNNWFHVQTSMSLDSGGFSANLRVGFDHGNMAAGMVVTRDIGVRVVASQAANNCGIAIGSPAFTGNWLGYVADGNDSGVSLDTGTLQVRSYTDAATRPAVWDTNGNLIEGSPAATAFTEEVGDNFHNVSLQTTNDTWTEAIRIPTASGHEESGELRVRARRTTTGGSRRMTGRWATLTEMDGTLLVEYAALGTKLGNVNCDARVRADGSDIVIEVLGRPSQTWDWTVVYFRRPF